MSTLLQLLPDMGKPAAAFPGSWNKYRSFLIRPPIHSPAVIQLEWHIEEDISFGKPVWACHAINIPNVDSYDILFPQEWNITPSDMAEVICECLDPMINRRTECELDLSNPTERVLVVVYRDTTDPADTAIGYAHLTHVSIRWE